MENSTAVQNEAADKAADTQVMYKGVGQYQIIVNPDAGQTRPDGKIAENYALVNTISKKVEFESNQYPAALEILTRFEDAIKTLISEYESKTSLIKKVTPINGNIGKLNS